MLYRADEGYEQGIDALIRDIDALQATALEMLHYIEYLEGRRNAMWRSRLEKTGVSIND